MVVLLGIEGGGTTWKVALARDEPYNIIERIEIPTTTPTETLGQIKVWSMTAIYLYH